MTEEDNNLYGIVNRLGSKIDKLNKILGLGIEEPPEEVVTHKDIKKTYYDVLEEFIKSGKKAYELGKHDDFKSIKSIINEIKLKYNLKELLMFKQETDNGKELRKRLQFEISNYLFSDLLQKYSEEQI